MNLLYPFSIVRRFFHVQGQEVKAEDNKGVKGRVVIGGGRGFVGTELCRLLRRLHYEVIIISRSKAELPDGNQVLTWDELSSHGLPEGTKAVVNLAGENVLNPLKQWTPLFQQKVYTSRVESAKKCRDAIVACPAETRPSVYVQISGVGYYPPSSTKLYDETASGGDHDFLAKLVVAWEEAATLPKEVTETRNVFIRSGVVLGRTGGMIANIFWQFFFGLGGRMGSGAQAFPWIHVKDLAELIRYSIENDNMSGVVNGVAPHLITNQEFVDSFAHALNRPAFIPSPAFLWKFIFGPERASMILDGQQVVPCRAMKADPAFKYRFPTIDVACQEFAQAFYKDPELA